MVFRDDSAFAGPNFDDPIENFAKSRAYNLVLGAAKALPKAADPDQYIKMYNMLEKRQDEILKEYEGKGVLGGAGQFVKNIIREGGDFATGLFHLADTLIEASEKDPEAVANILSKMPPAIAAGTAQALSEPFDSLATDPIGTFTTLIPAARLVRSAVPASAAAAAAKAPPKVAERINRTTEAFDRAADTILNKPVEDLLPGNIPLSRSEKVVGGSQARRRVDVPAGEMALTTGDILKSAAIPGAIGFATSGLAGGVAGLMAGAAYRGVISALRSGPKTAKNTALGGEFLGALDRIVKRVSASRNVSDGVAKSFLLSEAAKAGSKLQTQLRLIEDAIKRGDLDNANEFIAALEDVAPVKVLESELVGSAAPELKIASRVDQPPAGRTVQGVRRKLPESIQEPLDASLQILNEVVGGRAPYVRTQMDQIAGLESSMFLQSRAVRQGVIQDIQRRINRDLSLDEINKVTKKMNVMRSTAPLTDKPVAGTLRIGDVEININNAVQRTLREMPQSEIRQAMLGATGQIMQRELGALTARSFRNAIADNANMVANQIRVNYLGKQMPLSEAIKTWRNIPEAKGASLPPQWIDNLAEGIAESVIMRGETIPMALPAGVTFAQIRRRLNDRNFQQFFRAKYAQPDSPQFRAAMEGLVRSFDDGRIIGPTTELQLFKRDVEKLDADYNALREAGIDFSPDEKAFQSSLRRAYEVTEEGPLSRLNQMEVRPELANTLDWITNWNADTSKYSRVMNQLGSIFKRGNTVLSGGTSVLNNLGNAAISAVERGVPMPAIYVGYMNELIASLVYHNKWPKQLRKPKLSKDETALRGMLEDIGLDKADFTARELRNFLRADDTNSLLSSTQLGPLIDAAAGVLSKSEIAALVKRGARAGAKGPTKLYAAGDIVPKRVEIMGAMRQTLDFIRNIEPGADITIRTGPKVLRVIRRDKAGNYFYKNKKLDLDNLDAPQNKPLRDILMANARRRANDRFVDFGDRPGVLRAIDRAGLSGTILSPFLTWMLKVKGIGGPNLFRTVMGLTPPEYVTNSAKVNRMMAKQDAMKRARLAAILHTNKSRTDDKTDKLISALNPFAGSTAAGTTAAAKSPGMAMMRDFSKLSAIGEAVALYHQVPTLLGTIFDWGGTEQGRKDLEMSLAAKSGGSTNATYNAVINTMTALGFATDASAISIINGIVANEKKKSSQSWRKLRQALIGRTPNDVFEIIVGMLRDNDALPEWADEMLPETYYDYINRGTLPSQRQGRLRDFFVRNSAGLLADQAQIWGVLASTGIGSPGKLERNLGRMKKNLISLYYDPVVKRGGDLEDRINAWVDIRDWFNGQVIDAANGFLEGVKARENWDADETTLFRNAYTKMEMPPLPPELRANRLAIEILRKRK